jgi:hypothetical protein
MTTYNQDGTLMGGSGGSNQLIDLLTVVANPSAYKEKIDALDKATEENKKFIALVAPANEIIALREKIAQDAAASQTALDKAQQDAVAVVADAKAEAKKITKAAQEKADTLIATAQATVDEAKTKLAQAALAASNAQSQQEAVDKQAQEYFSKMQALDAEQAKLEIATAEAVKLKATLLAKHQAFIESL